ncbi:DUF2188 domain-containing protein [Phreatobacter stygius]|uniref:DUF2188 domain-containing protein n=1 Tax=Phreatobacter stygius TaxID=1940610 RepID=A0A4D7BEU1_9HYPH|nr:DUF2188 domain-containing protein [Phreatobacter stygius]QCI67766.1 DUF2188 domain-containing protein [Phreatobacter stygius]
MAELHYQIVQHDGGWAYKLGDVISETFASHDEAVIAAEGVAARQHRPGEPVDIEYEDGDGRWHKEHSSGDDRPDVRVDDAPIGRKS